MAVEEWRPYRSGAYEVSTAGRIRRAKPLTHTARGDGYLRCRLVLEGSGSGEEERYVHRIVAEAFHGPCPRGKLVHHKNGIRDDNRPENLQYVTPAQNLAYAAGLRRSADIVSENGRSVLWLTDRSRYELGLATCQFARYLEYAWGPYSTGISRKGVSVPLATGIYLHKAGEHIDRWCMAHDQPPPDAVVREACALATQEYERVVTLRGVRGLDESDRVETLIAEQRCLIEGLTWAYALHLLPWLLQHSRIVSVEQEEVLPLACTCGLGDRVGTQADHEARGCQGIGWQARADLVTEYRERKGVYALWDRKSTSQTGERWETQWETHIQMTATAAAVQARLGLPISEVWIIGLIKGKRGRDYNPETGKYDLGDIRQNSPLCYGYRRDANPPLEPVDWQATYKWVDTDGHNRKLGKSYQKTGIWKLAEDVTEVSTTGVSVSEFFCKWMPPEVLGQQISIIGPLQVNHVLLDQLFAEVVAEEMKWRRSLWELFDILEGEAEGDWLSVPYQDALRRLFPRSWACRRFGKTHQCSFVPICHMHQGHEDPLGSGLYVPRAPHHTPERAQVEARGLTPEEGWADEEEVD